MSASEEILRHRALSIEVQRLGFGNMAYAPLEQGPPESVTTPGSCAGQRLRPGDGVGCKTCNKQSRCGGRCRPQAPAPDGHAATGCLSCRADGICNPAV